MAQSIQHDQATLILELSAASTPNIRSPITSPGSQLRDAIVSIPLVQNIRQVTIADGDAGRDDQEARENRLEFGERTAFTVCQAISIAITVVLPEPVAIFMREAGQAPDWPRRLMRRDVSRCGRIGAGYAQPQ